MAPDDESDLDRYDGVSEFVPAVMARSMEEAEQYRDLLDDHDIPAVLGTDEDLDQLDMEEEDRLQARRRGMTHGVPVLVPESLLDEASEVISDRQAFDGFDEDDDEYDDEDDDDGLSPGELDLEDEDDDLILDDDEEEDDDELFGGLDDEDDDLDDIEF